MQKENQMYKAIKDSKIIAINETGDFPCLVYDEVVEDTAHTYDDYGQYNGEYLLKEDISAPTYEEIDKAREEYRKEHIDSKTAMRSRKIANKTWTDELEQEYLELDAKVTEYIEKRYPYPNT